MKRFDDLIGDERYNILQYESNKIALELFKEGFTKDIVYTFLHKTVDAGMHKVECGVLIGGQEKK